MIKVLQHRGTYGKGATACAFLLAACLAGPSAIAQATATATRTFALSAFAAGSAVSTDYAKGGAGFLVGGDLTHNYRRFDLSLEPRFSYASGTEVTEKTLTGAFRIERAGGYAGRLHPYGDVSAGYGVINFKHPIIYPTGPYSSDDSIIYGLGGGIDVDVMSSFAIKGDFQYSRWKLGTEQSGLTPYAASLGVVYHVNFRSLSGRRR